MLLLLRKALRVKTLKEMQIFTYVEDELQFQSAYMTLSVSLNIIPPPCLCSVICKLLNTMVIVFFQL